MLWIAAKWFIASSCSLLQLLLPFSITNDYDVRVFRHFSCPEWHLWFEKWFHYPRSANVLSCYGSTAGKPFCSYAINWHCSQTVIFHGFWLLLLSLNGLEVWELFPDTFSIFQSCRGRRPYPQFYCPAEVQREAKPLWSDLPFSKNILNCQASNSFSPLHLENEMLGWL